MVLGSEKMYGYLRARKVADGAECEIIHLKVDFVQGWKVEDGGTADGCAGGFFVRGSGRWGMATVALTRRGSGALAQKWKVQAGGGCHRGA